MFRHKCVCMCFPKLWTSAFLQQKAQWSRNKEAEATDSVQQMNLNGSVSCKVHKDPSFTILISFSHNTGRKFKHKQGFQISLRQSFTDSTLIYVLAVKAFGSWVGPHFCKERKSSNELEDCGLEGESAIEAQQGS